MEKWAELVNRRHLPDLFCYSVSTPHKRAKNVKPGKEQHGYPESHKDVQCLEDGGEEKLRVRIKELRMEY